MNHFDVPSTGIRLYDGTIVMLARFPGTKWIVHNGWYSYNNQQFMGWYFCSIPAKVVLPISDQDLNLLTVISNGEESNCPPWPPCPPGPPCPPVPPSPTEPFTSERAEELRRAFITVDTLQDLEAYKDKSKWEELCDGKIFRVNYPNHDGYPGSLEPNPDPSPEYYEAKWHGSPDDGFYEFHLLKTSDISELDKRVTKLEDNVEDVMEEVTNHSLVWNRIGN